MVYNDRQCNWPITRDLGKGYRHKNVLNIILILGSLLSPGQDPFVYPIPEALSVERLHQGLIQR